MGVPVSAGRKPAGARVAAWLFAAVLTVAGIGILGRWGLPDALGAGSKPNVLGLLVVLALYWAGFTVSDLVFAGWDLVRGRARPVTPVEFGDRHRWRFLPGLIVVLLFPRLAGPVERWVWGQRVTGGSR